MAVVGNKVSAFASGLVTALSLGLVLLAASPTRATSFVMTTDDELAERADLVVVGRIVSSDPAVGLEIPATDYLVEIERPIHGFAPGSTILLRTPGGVREDGLGFYAFGVPHFITGERVLLFLDAADAGTYRLVELGLGAFREREATTGERVAIRDLSAVHTFALPGDRNAAERLRSHLPRDLDLFADWLSDLAHGQERPADYFVAMAPEQLVAVRSAFTIITSSQCGASSGNPARWLDFDQGRTVGFRAHQDGQPGVPGGGFDQVANATRAWTRATDSRILLSYDGTSSNTNGAVSSDGSNMVIFEDKGNELDGSYGGGGGTLAFGTFFFNCLLFPFENGLAHPILEAAIVLQDGLGQNFFPNLSRPDLTLGELLTHELGHTVGIGHSCGGGSSPSCSGRAALDRATMRASIHIDDRGATIFPDDQAAAAFLYGSAGPSPGSQLPTSPTTLSATATSTSELTLSWADASTNETGFEVEEREFGADWRRIITVPAETTTLVVSGLAEASYRAYRVRAVNTAGASEYSPEASATTPATAGMPCVEDGNTLCLNGDRFRITVRFRTDQTSGSCQAVELSDDTGLCWFFHPENIELVVKALDGCDINHRFWVFAGGLTNVELELAVSDTVSGVARTYQNPPTTPFRPVQDIEAFEACPAV